jgi:hypothetical protein
VTCIDYVAERGPQAQQLQRDLNDLAADVTLLNERIEASETAIAQLRTESRPFSLVTAESGAAWNLVDFTRRTTTSEVSCTAEATEIADVGRTQVAFVVRDKATRPVTCTVWYSSPTTPLTQVGTAQSTGSGATSQPVTVTFAEPINAPGTYIARVTSGALGGGIGEYVWYGASLE